MSNNFRCINGCGPYVEQVVPQRAVLEYIKEHHFDEAEYHGQVIAQLV